MRAQVMAAGLAVALMAGGCGGSGGSGGDADPARAVPPDPSAYLEIVVRPEGEQKEAMTALAGKFLRTDDPAARVREIVEESLGSGGEKATWEDDLEPWLGRRAGIYLTGFEGDEPRWIGAVAARDAGALRDEHEQQTRDERAQSHSGEEFRVDADGEASAVLGDYLVVASGAGEMRRAIDAFKGDSLAESEAFEKAVEPLPGAGERAGLFLLDARRLFAAIAASDPDAGPALSALGLANAPPVAGALLAEADRLALEMQTQASGAFSPFSFAGTTDLIRELPGDAWAAVGAPDVGAELKRVIDGLGGAIGSAVIGAQLERELGLNLERDVLSWMGDLALFVRGDDPQSFQGAAVVAVTDAAAARRAVTKLAGLLQQRLGVPVSPVRVAGAALAFRIEPPGMPLPVLAALSAERFVVGVGEEAVADGLDAGGETLGDSDLYERGKAAADGLEPSALVDARTLVAVLEQVLAEDPDLAAARPYLEVLDVLAAGSETDDGRLRQVIGVKVR